MYHLDNTTDDRSSGQALITPVAIEDVALHGMQRWEIAMVFANNIRAALESTNTDSLGRSPIRQLAAASVITPTGTLYTGQATYYGEPETQGLTQNSASNICSSNTANGDIFHPLDFTLALSASLYSQYANRWVQVCAGSLCIAGRVTDSSGPSGPADLAKGGLAIPLGIPATVEVKTLP